MNSKIRKIIEQINQLSSGETAELKSILYKSWGLLRAKNAGSSIQYPKTRRAARIITSYRKSTSETFSDTYGRISKKPRKNSQVTIHKFRARLAGDPTA
jgi:hypothetical protein